MLNAVKIASLKVYGNKHSDVEKIVGEKVLRICNIKLVDKTKSFTCDVRWLDDETSASFCAKINVYYLYDDRETIKNHCDVCRETHNLFYCNRQYNCNQCEFSAYRHREELKNEDMRSAGKFALNNGLNK